MTDIDFKNQEEPILTDKTTIHENDNFSVQWVAMNTTNSDIKPFSDGLVITSIPEGCPGTDGADHPVVFDSSTDGRASDYTSAEPLYRLARQGRVCSPPLEPFPGWFISANGHARSRFGTWRDPVFVHRHCAGNLNFPLDRGGQPRPGLPPDPSEFFYEGEYE